MSCTSPSGPGSFELAFIGGPPFGTYFLVATLHGGSYPNGWFFGVDIPIAELNALYLFGYPFLGPLDAAGAFTLGPFPGGSLPGGLTLYAVVLGIPGPVLLPSMHSNAVAYTIP